MSESSVYFMYDKVFVLHCVFFRMELMLFMRRLEELLLTFVWMRKFAACSLQFVVLKIIQSTQSKIHKFLHILK